MSTTPEFRPSQSDASVIRRVYERLSDYLEMDISGRQDIVRITHQGVAWVAVINILERAQLKKSELAWVIQPRTLEHRRQADQVLSIEESGRLFRLAKILALAEEVLGDKEKAKVWLNKPRKSFDGHSAMELMKTEEGAQLVEEVLWKIDAGHFA